MEVNKLELEGQTITKIEKRKDDELYISTKEGNHYKMYHEQDCCESVRLYEMVGEIENILNSPITLAEEDSSEPKDWKVGEWSESYSFSTYYLETVKGRLEIYFLGESNGYYSESMNFYKVK